MRGVLAVGCAAACCWLAAAAGASPGAAGSASDEGAEPRDDDGRSASRSLGWPWRGRLRRGVELEPSPRLRHAKSDTANGHFYGTEELVGLIERATKAVERHAPGARLTVGELSKRGGGRIVGHRSHQNGRDVDVGFYLVEDGEPAEAEEFVRINWRGRGRLDGRTVRFDAERNWRFVHALMHDAHATVQHVFTARTVRRRLLREAKRQGASEALLEKAEHVILPPGVRHPHRNHFHIRIYCPAEDVPGCRDKGPFWPWLPAAHPFSERRSPPFAHIE